MKKGQIVTGIVERIDYQNKGLVRIDDDGHLLYVANVIPLQRVKVRVQKAGKSGIGKGLLVEVIEPSPLETAADPCRMAGICGGCVYQTVAYHEQLEIKAGQIRRLLAPVIGEAEYDAAFEGVYESPDRFEYRNKMEFSFGDSEKGGPLTLGLHRRGSFYDITDASDCRIIDADMRLVVRITAEYFRERGISYFHRNTHEGYLRHLLLRRAVNTGELLVDLVTVPASEISDIDGDMPDRAHCACMSISDEKELLGGWRDALVELEKRGGFSGRIAGILHTRCERISDVIEDDGTDILYGTDHIVERILGLSFKITLFSFFQTNSRGAEVLYEVARRYVLGETKSEGAAVLSGKHVYDLYSGTGTIAQLLAPAAAHVTSVEIVPEAVRAARENAAHNGIDNCDFIAGDVLKVLDDISEKPDMIVLDPPRDGIHPKALPKIISYGVDEILYISCKATSLARDLPAFMSAGYRVTRIGIVDMFPETGHCETVCLLGRRKPDDTIKVSVNMDDYYQIRDAEEAEKNPS